MKKIVLVLCFLLFASGELFAEEMTIIDSGTCGIGGADNCQWSLDSTGKLTVTGNGATDDYRAVFYNDKIDVYKSPWSDHQSDIRSVEIYGLSTIGKGAFGYLPNLKDVYIDDSVNTLKTDAFWASPIESLRMSDSVTTIGQAAFQGNNLTTITLPDTATISHTSLGGNPEMQIICKGSQQSCSNLMNQMQQYSMYRNGVNSIVDLSNNIHLADDTNCSSAKYYWNGTICKNRPESGNIECIDGYAANLGNCYRVRYTLPEADAATSNDNENMIEWIFE